MRPVQFIRMRIDTRDIDAHLRHLEWIMREFGAVSLDDEHEVQPHKRSAWRAELKSAEDAFGACIQCE